MSVNEIPREHGDDFLPVVLDQIHFHIQSRQTGSFFKIKTIGRDTRLGIGIYWLVFYSVIKRNMIIINRLHTGDAWENDFSTAVIHMLGVVGNDPADAYL